MITVKNLDYAYYPDMEEKVIGNCDYCNEEIYEEEDYYYINGQKICMRCILDYCSEHKVRGGMSYAR